MGLRENKWRLNGVPGQLRKLLNGCSVMMMPLTRVRQAIRWRSRDVWVMVMLEMIVALPRASDTSSSSQPAIDLTGLRTCLPHSEHVCFPPPPQSLAFAISQVAPLNDVILSQMFVWHCSLIVAYSLFKCWNVRSKDTINWNHVDHQPSPLSKGQKNYPGLKTHSYLYNLSETFSPCNLFRRWIFNYG